MYSCVPLITQAFSLSLLGGLGEAVASVLAGEPGITLTKLAVTGIPRSGKPDELLEMFGISANRIIKAVKQMLNA